MENRKRFIVLALIMAVATLGVGGAAIGVLYDTAFEEKRADLTQTAQSQARLIEAIARFDQKYSSNYPEGSLAATLSQIRDAHDKYEELGGTGEFTLARREGNQIIFLLRHRHQDTDKPAPVPFTSALAEPMRQALSGKSGTIVGLDYQGTTVLAAHEPLPVLKLGIVAKVDLTEVRAPFLKAGIIVVGIVVVVILVGTILFFRIGDPIVRQIQQSEERFRVILETSSIVVMTMDRELKYTWIFNPVPGFSSETVVGKRDTDLLSPEDGAAQAAFRKGVLDSGVGDRREFTQSLPSGLTTMDINCEPLRDAKGSIVGLTVVAIDITERKRVEEAVRESEQRLHAVFENTPVCLNLKDTEGRYLLVNKPYEEWLGLPADEIIGKKASEFLENPDRVNRLTETEIRVLETGEANETEIRVARLDGKTYDRLVIKFPVKSADETITAIGTVAIDITERKQVEEALLESEERLLAVTNHAPANIFLKDMEGRIVLGNKGFEEWNQTTLDEARGKSSFDLFPSWLAEKYTAMDRQAVESGVAVESEIETVKGDGSTVHSWNVKFPVFGFDGKVRWIGGITMDITERKKALEELRENEQRFRDFAEVSSDWFWEMDDDLRFSFLSDRFFDLSSVKNDDVIGITRREMAGEEQVQADPEKWDAHFADLDGHKPFRHFVYVITSDDGTESHVTISGVPVFSDDGRFLGYRGTGTNVTALKHAEKIVWDAKEQAEFANRSKTEFLANMSHELRTPLTIINGASDILSTEMFGPIDNPSYLDYAKNIRDAGEHLLRLINDILNISQIEMGRFELDEDHMELNAIIASCHHLFEGRAQEAGLRLTKEVKEKLPALRGDELRIKQVVLNLLSNAVKFTPNGGTVTLRTGADDDGRVIFSVSDTGIGIAAEDISRVLDTFGQVEQGFSRNYQGAGIGLPLSKRLVELHGGTLELESELGVGTTVTVRFPLDRVIN